jgi:hypothetical protein
MLRPVLLLAAVAILAFCDAAPPQLDRCASVFCISADPANCPGEYLPYNPPERCCGVCTVYKGLFNFNLFIHKMATLSLSHVSFRTIGHELIMAC